MGYLPEIQLPIFTSTSRKLIIEGGKLDWSSINPDIFGSMIQAVVHPGQRENLGMHYTSVPNIMKVIEPLFLNDLYVEFEKSRNDFNKLTKLRERISKIKIFDPACGSGNFLIISYKELCKLEIEIIKQQNEIGAGAISYSGISLNSFYGIEIDDFAHEVARLSLWLTQHQMNQYFNGMFGVMKPTLPLKESGKIICANATRVDWNEVCPRKDHLGNETEIFVVGNPPYLGSRNQDEDQKNDMEVLFISEYKSLDYISAWFYKGADYIAGYKNVKLALVSTNSISQGEQVSLFWPKVFKKGVEILFAVQSFKWKNLAKGNAGVTCVIIGLSNPTKDLKRIYTENQYINVKQINAYLVEGGDLFISPRTKALSNFPKMIYGNYTGGCDELFLDPIEKEKLINKYPVLKSFIRKFVGSQEFIKGIERYCLWFKDSDLEVVNNIPEIQEKFNKIKKTRLASKDPSLNKLAVRPHQFRDLNETKHSSIVIPIISSERRNYIPCGFVDKQTIIPNSAQAIYDSEPWIFAILSSRSHAIWIKSVCGSLETRIRYSSVLGYNTFPFPNITPKQKESLTSHVYNILEEREKYPEKTMADLYDPDKMPDGLREAHKYLDLAIDQIYRSKPFESDEERLAHLFKLYEEMITSEAKK